MGPRLSKRKIAAQHSESRCTERIGQRRQQKGLTVCPSAVRQDQTILARNRRPVQEAANRRVLVCPVNEFVVAWHIPQSCPQIFRKCTQVDRFPIPDLHYANFQAC
jgi:hypothetical protein